MCINFPVITRSFLWSERRFIVKGELVMTIESVHLVVIGNVASPPCAVTPSSVAPKWSSFALKYVCVALNFDPKLRATQHARRKALRLSNCLFLLSLISSVLQYTIPLKSKFISFYETLINLLGSHSLSLSGYFFLNCGILTLIHCTLCTFF